MGSYMGWYMGVTNSGNHLLESEHYIKQGNLERLFSFGILYGEI